MDIACFRFDSIFAVAASFLTIAEPMFMVESVFPEREVLREDFIEGEEMIEDLAGNSEDIKKEVGYSLEDMVVDCQYAGSDCSYKRYCTLDLAAESLN